MIHSPNKWKVFGTASANIPGKHGRPPKLTRRALIRGAAQGPLVALEALQTNRTSINHVHHETDFYGRAARRNAQTMEGTQET